MLFYLLHAILVCYLLFPSVELEAKVQCTNSNTCISVAECAQRHHGNKLPGIPFPCGSRKICCPPMTVTSHTSHVTVPTLPTSGEEDGVAYKSHRNYHLLPQECGRIASGDRITEGTDAVPGEFPWMALIGIKDGKKFQGGCGGSLINKRYVITAAHCLSNKENVEVEYVRLREFNLTTEKDFIYGAFREAIEIGIEKATMHYGWNNTLKTTMKNDIALLRLNRDVIEKDVSPICLPIETNELPKTADIEMTAAGWGTIDPEVLALHSVLLKAQLKVLPLNFCNTCTVGKEDFCPLTDNQICGQGFKGVDVCKGDSGGPLMYTRGLKTYLAGITSFSPDTECGKEQKPSIFTKVRSYTKWILDTIRE